MKDINGPMALTPDGLGARVLGSLLQKLRKHNGFKGRELAELLGVSISLISMIERGSRIPTRELLQDMITLFEKNYGIFWGKEGDLYDIALKNPENGQLLTFRFPLKRPSYTATSEIELEGIFGILTPSERDKVRGYMAALIDVRQ